MFRKTQTKTLTLNHFHSNHICHRDVRDLPLSVTYENDFDRLRSCCILTITDLIGRYLIHRTPDDFRQFLIEKVECSRSFAEEIIQLISAWSFYNLQIGGETRTKTLRQYL